MLRSILSAAVLLIAFATPSIAQEKTWAASVPDSEKRMHIAHGNSQRDASSNALALCRKISRTCADSAATTDDLRDSFVLSCCANPRVGCIVSVAEPKDSVTVIPPDVVKDFRDQGFSSCEVFSVRHSRDVN